MPQLTTVTSITNKIASTDRIDMCCATATSMPAQAAGKPAV
jgi:hypothetical protein